MAKKLKPSVFIAAAEITDQPGSQYCCHSLRIANGDSISDRVPRAEESFFHQLYLHDSYQPHFGCGAYFSDQQAWNRRGAGLEEYNTLLAEEKQHRVFALLLAAEVAKDENKS